jgi:tryptophan-rich sensory protein
MHRADWQKAAILFSAAWIVVVAVSIGVSAYHQFACTPTVERLADGTIIRHACVAAPLTWRAIAHVAGYLVGGTVVISLLSWIFLGWPSEVLSRYTRRRR